MPPVKRTIPVVNKRRRGSTVFLRIWFNSRWHPVGREGDPAAAVRQRIMAIIGRDETGTTPAVVTVAELFRRFLESAYAPVDPKDRHTFGRCTLLLASFVGVNTAADAVTAKQIEDWRDWLCTQKGLRGQGGKEKTVERPTTLSAQYITRLLAFTRRAYRFGVREGIIPASLAAEIAAVGPPVASSAPAPGKARRSPARQAADSAALAAIVSKLKPPYDAMLILQRATGMRPSEMCRMISKDIHRSGVVAIPGGQAVDLAKDGRGCWLWVPTNHKTAGRGKCRAVVIPPRAQAALRPYLERYQPFPVTVETYSRALGEACKAAGVAHATAYQVRHTVGAETAAEGGLHAVMQRLGHSNPATAARYVGIDLGTVFRVAAAGELQNSLQ